MAYHKVKVLIVDDSALVRQKLKDILSQDEEIEVLGLAGNPYEATRIMSLEAPDVILLDIEMPLMDGLTFLNKIMTQHPIPVVICSSLAEENSHNNLKALEYGAVEIIQKPKLGTRSFFEESKILICDTVKAASQAHLRPLKDINQIKAEPKLSADAIIPKPAGQADYLETTEKIAVIGASTGGTEAIRFLASNLPSSCPGIVIVQHMPEIFTRSFADSLDKICEMSVKEAQNGDPVLRGQILIAPGNKHTLVKRSGARYYVEVRNGPLISRHRPSVDVLFRSAARYAGKNAVGLIMTGMGDDGAQGMLEMYQTGAVTIAQDEKSCVVFGMPNKAIELGGVSKIAPLKSLPKVLYGFLS